MSRPQMMLRRRQRLEGDSFWDLYQRWRHAVRKHLASPPYLDGVWRAPRHVDATDIDVYLANNGVDVMRHLRRLFRRDAESRHVAELLSRI